MISDGGGWFLGSRNNPIGSNPMGSRVSDEVVDEAEVIGWKLV